MGRILIIAELPTLRRLTRRPPVAMRASRSPQETACTGREAASGRRSNAKSAAALPGRERRPDRLASASGYAATRGPPPQSLRELRRAAAEGPRTWPKSRVSVMVDVADANPALAMLFGKLKPRGSPVIRAPAWVRSEQSKNRCGTWRCQRLWISLALTLRREAEEYECGGQGTCVQNPPTSKGPYLLPSESISRMLSAPKSKARPRASSSASFSVVIRVGSSTMTERPRRYSTRNTGAPAPAFLHDITALTGC
jgi:hypothetical protein